MDEPQWIEPASVLLIHDRQLERHGGLAGTRDEGLLLSALHRARNVWAYGGAAVDMAALAAAYAAGIARNHPFFDGNKRTAAVVCETFIELNGHALIANDDEWYDAMIRLAASEIDEVQLAEWLRTRLACDGD